MPEDTSMPVYDPGGPNEQFNIQCPYPECGWEFHPGTDTGSLSCANPFVATHNFTMVRVGDEIACGIE
jgi:hypothetical protein